MSLKPSERLAMIAEYIKSGKCPDGYSITEPKDGKYCIRKVPCELDKLRAKRERLRRQLELVEKALQLEPEGEGKDSDKEDIVEVKEESSEN